MDLVSVIVPMYNSKDTIIETLNSIRVQTYTNLEVLIVDDLSTDSSYQIVQDYIKYDNRFKLFKLKKKGGASEARNLAIRLSNGKFVAFLDSDDLWFPEKIEKQVKFLEQNNYMFVYSYYNEYDVNKGRVTSIRKGPKKVGYSRHLFGNTIGCLTVIYNAEEVGLVQIPYLKKRNDQALWQKILAVCKTGYALPEVLATYRKDSSSLSRKDSKLELLNHHYKLYKINMNFSKFKSIVFTFFNVLNYIIVKILYTKKIPKIEEEDL